MNFCVVPREMREINKRGGGVKISCVGVSKNHEKNKRPPPVYFEPESTQCVPVVYVHSADHRASKKV